MLWILIQIRILSERHPDPDPYPFQPILFVRFQCNVQNVNSYGNFDADADEKCKQCTLALLWIKVNIFCSDFRTFVKLGVELGSGSVSRSGYRQQNGKVASMQIRIRIGVKTMPIHNPVWKVENLRVSGNICMKIKITLLYCYGLFLLFFSSWPEPGLRCLPRRHPEQLLEPYIPGEHSHLLLYLSDCWTKRLKRSRGMNQITNRLQS